MNKFARGIFPILVFMTLCSCAARESHRSLQPVTLSPSGSRADIEAVRIAVGEFINRSTYMNGIFADSSDRIGQQAQQILVTHLSQNPSFTVVDRRNLDALQREAKLNRSPQNLTGAEVIVTGAVTEFGRRETGTKSLAGIIHKTKTQSLYAKVALSLVDVRTSKVMKTYQGAGEYDLTNKEVLGFGGYAGYDSTLADKVLNLAIMEAIERTIEGRRSHQW